MSFSSEHRVRLLTESGWRVTIEPVRSLAYVNTMQLVGWEVMIERDWVFFTARAPYLSVALDEVEDKARSA